MSVSFEWDFKEEPSPSQGPPPSRRRRWLWWGGVALALLVVVGLAVRAWVTSRLDVIEDVEAQLGELVELELEAIAKGDAEVLRLRQDPSDPDWQDQQVSRYISSSEAFVPAPGMRPAERAPEIQKVLVTGPTGRVELRQWFEGAPRQRIDADGPFPFVVTWFYRLDEDGVWYHVAPPEDYRGVRYSWHGDWLDVYASEVEAELLDAVAPELILLTSRGCRRLDCPEWVHYSLYFEGTEARGTRSSGWMLPALYLTGLPEGEASRAAWTGALKLWLVEALARAQAGAGVSDRLLYRELVTRLQAEFGLAEPRLPDTEALARALQAGEQHALQDLWTAEAPEASRLLAAEVTAWVGWLEERVGARQLFELLPALDAYPQPDMALLATWRIPPMNLEVEWLTYLAQLSGLTVESILREQTLDPPLLPVPSFPPGDQIAFLCDGRIWVGNADGSDMLPLTDGAEEFQDLHWSPDGRWLLTAWLPQHASHSLVHAYQGAALYLLSADGRDGRLLTHHPVSDLWLLGWSPDARTAIYVAWHDEGDSRSRPRVWAVDIESEMTTALPGLPFWSPDGRHLLYSPDAETSQTNALWIADVDPPGSVIADWEGARLITTEGRMWSTKSWAPDGTELAFASYEQDTQAYALSLYDVTTGQLTPLATADDLRASVVIEGARALLNEDFSPRDLDAAELQSLWPAGWSADGQHVLAMSRWRGDDWAYDLTLLSAIPVDGASPQVLAFGDPSSVAWSPVDPDQLVLAFSETPRQSAALSSYVLNLQAGLVYTVPHRWNAAWSPDGEWLTFHGQGRVLVGDAQGQQRFGLPIVGYTCGAPVWNPAAELSLSPTLILTSSVSGWQVGHLRVYRDAERTLHVWGEVTNLTGEDQRIRALTPTFYDSQGDPLEGVAAITFVPDDVDLARVSLANGRRRPFSFVARPSEAGALEDVQRIVLGVQANVSAPTRDDLDIPTDTFDLSAWPEALVVRGQWENLGLDLTEYLMVLVTAYGEDGQVLGWGRQLVTDPADLVHGLHDFEVRVALSELVADLDLELGTYRLQLLGR